MNLIISFIKKALYPAVLAALIFSAAMAPGPAFCEEARVDDVIVARKPPFKLSFLVKDAFTKDIEEAVKSGLPTSFTYIIELDRINNVWFNERVNRWEFKHTVKFDSLKEEYEVTIEEREGAVVRTKDFAEMKRLMTASEMTLESRELLPGQEYEFRIMAELHTLDLPPVFDYVLFFLKVWDFKTDWYSYRFIP